MSGRKTAAIREDGQIAPEKRIGIVAVQLLAVRPKPPGYKLTEYFII